MGCAVAWSLKRSGADVTLIEAQECGSRASWAAAGMLSPYGEVGTPGAFQDLAVASLAEYPEFVRMLESDAGRSVHYVPSGRLDLAFSSEEATRIHQRAAALAAAHVEGTLLEADELHTLEPHIASSGVMAALHLPMDAHVDNRELGPALATAAARLGATVLERTAASELLFDSDRCVGVRCGPNVTVEGDLVVLATGATGPAVQGSPVGHEVHAVHGEMIAYRAPHRLTRMVHTEDVYIIQRGSRLLVGATTETGVREARITEGARAFLMAGARKVLPSLPEAPFEQWAGLRPATADGLPILGADPKLPGLAYATGHFRNGILLAPAMMGWAPSLIGQPPSSERLHSIDWAAFRVDR